MRPYHQTIRCKLCGRSRITVALLTLISVVLFIKMFLPSTPSTFHLYQTAISSRNICATRFSPTNTTNVRQEVDDPLLAAARRIRVHSKTLLVPVLNDAYLPFAYNWLCNTKDMGLHQNMLIISTDDRSSEILKCDWPKVSTVSMNVNTLNGDKGFQETGYFKVNVKRHQHIYRLLKAGYEILHFDLDQFWPRNPLPYLQNYQGYDLLVTLVSGQPGEYCSGFVYIFNNERTIKLWELFVKKLEEYSREVESYSDKRHVPIEYMDQVPWTKIIQNKTIPGLSVKELSLDEFADGYWFDHKTEEQRLAIDPYVIHNNYIIGNSAKMDRALQFNQWFLDRELKCDMDLVHRVVRNG